jgi:hypothetical protein
MEKRFLVAQVVNGGNGILSTGQMVESMGQAVTIASLCTAELGKAHQVFHLVAVAEPITAPVTAKVSYL